MVKTFEFLAEVMPTLPSKHYLFPFLAHALGTLIGAFIAGLIAPKVFKIRAAINVGLLFFVAGILVNYMIPGPIWFTFLDIVVAYFPMAWLGGKIALKFSRKN